MRERFAAAAMFGTVLTLVGAAGPAVATPTDAVNFVDVNLRACVNESLGQPAGAVITVAQAAAVRTVDCNFREISDLAGAETLTGATELRFYESRSIVDVSPLAGLTQLTLLDLGFNSIEDVSRLAGLATVEWLSLSGNQVTDLSPLSDLESVWLLQSARQVPVLSVPCGATVPNPVVDRAGRSVPLTGVGYDPVSNTIDTSIPGVRQFTWSTGFAPFDVFSGALTVKTNCVAKVSGSYVAAENGGGSALIANRDTSGPWEKFELISNADGSHSLRALTNGKLVTAENGGKSPLIANRDAIGPWEKFELISNADGSHSLRALTNGKLVTAESGGKSPLIANRDAIGPWEKFVFTHHTATTISIQSLANQ